MIQKDLCNRACHKQIEGKPPLYRCSSAWIPSRSSWVLRSEQDSPELQQSPARASVLALLLPALRHRPHFSVPAWLLSPYSLPLIFICHLIAAHTLTVMFCREKYNRKKEHPDILLMSPVCYFKQHLQNSDLPIFLPCSLCPLSVLQGC